MPAWKERLKDDEIRATVAYIESLADATAEASPVAASGNGSAGEAFSGSPAAARGRDLFFEPNGCGSCHALAGRGTAVGPDVSKMPGEKIPAAMRSTQSRRVRTIKLKDGERFPGVAGAEDGGFVQVFDLTAPPPVRRTIEKGDIESMTPVEWSHPRSYSDGQLADISAYIGWVGGAGRSPQ